MKEWHTIQDFKTYVKISRHDGLNFTFSLGFLTARNTIKNESILLIFIDPDNFKIKPFQFL